MEITIIEAMKLARDRIFGGTLPKTWAAGKWRLQTHHQGIKSSKSYGDIMAFAHCAIKITSMPILNRDKLRCPKQSKLTPTAVNN